MRISDWSSDVCSSDLPHCDEFILAHPVMHMHAGAALFAHGRFPAIVVAVGRLVVVAEEQPCVVREAEQLAEDRKSVVSGKSVSVRVDLGGRRIIKKQITTALTYNIRSITKGVTKKRRKT